MDRFRILAIQEHRNYLPQAAEWFHKSWGIAVNVYLESMERCIEKTSDVPQWYIVLHEGMIIAGIGVVENDFHDRKDLTPNVCAVFVDIPFRNQGIAGKILQFVCNEFEKKGTDQLYLLTDHTSFYERYGWEFLCFARGDGEPEESRMYIYRIKKPILQ